MGLRSGEGVGVCVGVGGGDRQFAELGLKRI